MTNDFGSTVGTQDGRPHLVLARGVRVMSRRHLIYSDSTMRKAVKPCSLAFEVWYFVDPPSDSLNWAPPNGVFCGDCKNFPTLQMPC